MRYKHAFVLLLLVSSVVTAQREKGKSPTLGREIRDQQVFTAAEMKANWEKFSENQGWKALMADVAGRRFKRIDHEKAMWGFKGVMQNEEGKNVDVMFCAYDFYNPEEKRGQGCSMIWRKVGDDVYKAYIVFPPGVKESEKAFAGAREWFADNDGKVQDAHSFNKCFLGCVRAGNTRVSIPHVGTISTGCATSCVGALLVCGAVTGLISAATGGIGVPAAIALYFGCAGLGCASCLATCALGCR